jgi:hypothetical protein
MLPLTTVPGWMVWVRAYRSLWRCLGRVVAVELLFAMGHARNPVTWGVVIQVVDVGAYSARMF